jgi:nonsense-mediated mRNA decay protein 3
VVIATQCPDCARSFTVNTWRAAIQIRQKVPHKRTFFYLEQLILKHNAHVDTVSIKESRDGIDFYYSERNHAMRMLDFLSAVVPLRYKRSEELISQDTHTGVKSYKFTFSVELVPVCRDDLVVLPKSLAHSLGNISPVVLCSRIQSSLQFLDPNTLQTCEVAAPVYWRTPFPSLCDSSELVNFVVLDIVPLGPVRGKWALADCTVARDNSFDQQFLVRTHLGGILHPGDDVLGYFTANSNFNNSHWDEVDAGQRPDVVLVKKYYRRRRKPGSRNWKLRRMAKEQEEDTAAGRNAAGDRERVERDYEMFLQELEEDQELRSTINLYKESNSANRTVQDTESMADDEEEADGPTINVDELLDDLEGMTIE